MSGLKKGEVSINVSDILRQLGSLAILLVVLPYSVMTIGAQAISMAGIAFISVFIYLLGFLGLMLAVLSYMAGDMEKAKILFSGSIVITSISLLALNFGNISNSGYYIGASILYMIMGAMMFYLFKNENTMDQKMKDNLWMGIGLMYLLANILQAAYIFGGLGNMSFDDILLANYFIPQTLILGGVFGFFVALLMLFKPVTRTINNSEDNERIVNLLLLFFLIAGFLYEVYIRFMSSFTYATQNPPSGIFSVLLDFGFILLLGQIFFSILIAALLLHVVHEYTIKRE